MRDVLVAVAQWARVSKPASLIPLLVWLRTAVIWSRSSGRERARADIRTLLGDVPGGELDALARRHVYFSCLRSEARFHHQVNSSQRVVGGEHLVSAAALGRGVVIGFLHHGHYEGGFPSVAAAGHPVHVVVAAESVAAGEGDPEVELWRTHHARTVTSHPDCRLVSVDIGFRGMLRLLAQGDTVALACDFPGGRVPVQFLGREWFGMTSVGGLSLKSGAPVVPLISRPAGKARSYVEFGAPILPEDFADPAQLTAAVLAALEPGVRAWPEAYDVPAQMWIPYSR